MSIKKCFIGCNIIEKMEIFLWLWNESGAFMAEKEGGF